MPLQPGDRAPEIALPSHTRETVSLADYRGKQPVVVLFFPLAFTGTCTKEMCTVGEELGSYQRLNAQVLAVSVDSPFVLERFRAECGADFPFLSDFHREAAEAFGVVREGVIGPGLRGVSDRAAFVVDPGGTIAYAWHSTNPSLLPPFDEIRAALEKAA